MTARKQYLLRIDPHLWTHVEQLAAAELRSVNAQVEVLLREAISRRSLPESSDTTPSRTDATARRRRA